MEVASLMLVVVIVVKEDVVEANQATVGTSAKTSLSRSVTGINHDNLIL
jgi:hypothetical protein